MDPWHIIKVWNGYRFVAAKPNGETVYLTATDEENAQTLCLIYNLHLIGYYITKN